MAGPFDFFRKNQRVWMAGLVIVAIISFVILPNLDNFVRPNNGGVSRKSQTLVSWKGGRIDAERMQKLQFVHGQTYRIFQQMANEVIEKGGYPNVPGFSMGQQGMEIGIERPQNIQSVLQVKLFAEAARKRGVVIDDKTVDQFIQQFSDKKISAKRFNEIVREFGSEQLTKFDMYDFLRDEIAKQMLVQMGYSGFASSQQSLVSPSKNWMNYQKFNQRAKVEAYPVFVDQYIGKVTARPSDQELRSLYNKSKDLLRQADRSEPGYRRPHQANVEFLVADLAPFLKEEEAKVTEEMLKTAYDKRVEEGAFKVPVEEFKPTEPAAPAKESTPEPAAPSKESTPEPAAPTKESTPEPVSEPSKPDNSSIQSTRVSRSRLIAFQTEPADKPAAEASTEAPKTVEPVDKPASEATADAPKTAELEKAQADASEKKDEKPMRVKSFDEVREEVRRSIALPPAQERMRAAIAAAREAMDLYFNQLSFFNSGNKKDPSNIEPTLPVLSKIADQFGLGYGKTGMVSAVQAETIPIGRGLIIIGGTRFETFPNVVFNNTLRLFQPEQTYGTQTFLFWKTMETVSRVPAFEEVRDEVLTDWKLSEARKLASKAAEDLVGSINTATDADPWPKVLNDASLLPLVLRPPAFTYLQPMNNSNEGIQLSQVEGIEFPGQAFLDRAFATPLGKASFALDGVQQKCFVIRVLERTPSDAELLLQFERAPLNRGVQSLAREQTSVSVSRWFDSLVREMDVDLSKLGPSGDASEE